MAEDWDKIKWEQLNHRSRWYSSQIWYVPFAYVGIVGFAFDRIAKLSYPLNSLGCLLLGIFSIAVLVHVLALKFYERGAVKSMQDVEDSIEGSKIISGGGSLWYLNFAWYIKSMICLASYLFIGYGLYLVKTIAIWQEVLTWIPLVLLTVLYVVIFRKDYVRNRDLAKKIRDRT